MRVLSWLVRGFLFFTLFAFALNNQHPTTVHFFFGTQWTSPLVIVVLVAFALGCASGVVAMLPGWWKHRRAARRAIVEPQPATALGAAPAAEPANPPTIPRQAL